ncbi:Flp family type IVb pilin [Alcaligenes sp. SDU_A2]|uniref:Flp family type IVb pilin n=1 Tax=Alcaligenes sp. SDU_A2 TaxID=3136634 RepID=UPI002C56FEA3|nr:Flp family type IVb pilin [Alcaligenes faecalis]
MKAQLQQFWNDEDGATAIEYGLIAGLIAVAIIGVLGTLSGKLEAMFKFIGDNMPTAANQSGSDQP